MSNHDAYTQNRIGIVATSGTEPRQPTAEETRFASLTQAEREEHINRMRHAAAKADHDAKEAALQERVRAATELSLKHNHAYQHGGGFNFTATVRDGQAAIQENRTYRSTDSGSSFPVAPPAMINETPIHIGGIQLGPKQAKEMMETGQISRDDYEAALNVQLAKRGFKAPSFR